MDNPRIGRFVQRLLRQIESLLENSDCDGKPQQMARPQMSGCCFSNSFCKMIIPVFEDQRKTALDFTFYFTMNSKKFTRHNLLSHKLHQRAMMLAADPCLLTRDLSVFSSLAQPLFLYQFDPGRFHMLELHSAQTQLLYKVA